MSLEAFGEGQKRSADNRRECCPERADRRMEFTLPNGEKVAYLDKAGQII